MVILHVCLTILKVIGIILLVLLGLAILILCSGAFFTIYIQSVWTYP